MFHSGNELINPFKTLERAGLQPGNFVADLGCGALGHFVFPAAQMVGGDGRVYAVDLDRRALTAIERKARFEQFWNIIPLWSDIEVMHGARIHDESLDLVIIANNLYLAKNRAGLVSEAFRLTKPGGRVLVIEWQACEMVLGPDPAHRLEVDAAKEVFHHPELALVGEFEPGDCHYALVYERHLRTAPHVLHVNPIESEDV
jgi:ubiquinone/menaquinone biosynthesis C-methylase UbiE